MLLSKEETSDLNIWIYEKLRHEFGSQVKTEWCEDFTTKLVEQAEQIRNENHAAYFAARNERMARATKENHGQS